MSTATFGRANHILNIIDQKEVGNEQLVALVNRDLSLAEMISVGKYDWVSGDITVERFPIVGSGLTETNFELVHFNRDISSEDAAAELAKRGLRPADLAELLAFGSAFPEKQRKDSIVGLGSVAGIDCYRYVAYLDGDVSERYLALYGWGARWGARFRFLAARK
jgi:hypothetical protein